MKCSPVILQALFGVLAVVPVRAAFVVTFDPPTEPLDSTFVTEFVEQEMHFTTPNGMFHRDSGASAVFPDNGTAYMAFAGFMDPLTLSTQPGQVFTITSVDLAEYSLSFFSPQLTFEGRTVQGTTISTTFDLDGTQDGTGATEDFETFTLGPEFSDLVQLQVLTSGYAMDNLVVELRTIPEPGAPVFLLLAGAALWVARRRAFFGRSR